MSERLYFRTRQWVPVSNTEVVTLYETDLEHRVLRYLVVGGEQTDLFRGPSYRLEPSSALEACPAEDFLSRWSPGRSPSRTALPDLVDQEPDGPSEEDMPS